MDRLIMNPAPGERMLKFVGDCLTFELALEGLKNIPEGWQARLRTTIGRGRAQDEEVIRAFDENREVGEDAWHDVPMTPSGTGWKIDVAFTEPGFFKAKAYVIDTEGRQHWPDGGDFGVSIHPDSYRTANTIYCAWPRLFGETKELPKAINMDDELRVRDLDDRFFTVIPPSGKLRDLQTELPHIIKKLGCRIVHLLPVNPTPTTMARMGRYGSPYAALDLTGIDPALIDFDKKSTGVEQFEELAYETHALGGRLFIDIVINHTGWGSLLWENHPEWFLRKPDGEFASPGAWGNVWADLVELNHHSRASWDYFAEAFLTWCRRGVDGFRCDAGYMIPMRVWRYILARVRREFPETVFLLEGLGGALEITEELLTEGGMQWAYSELFQNYSGEQVRWYLDYALRKSEQVGYYVHYSETHDNNRLAAQSPEWSLMRNRLCGLTSVGGGFGFTCGVEWLADEKIDVHHCSGLNWGAETNLVEQLSILNKLLASHPCFYDGATFNRLSKDHSAVFALERISADSKDAVLVLVNTDVENEHSITVSKNDAKWLTKSPVDLLGQELPKSQPSKAGESSSGILIPPGDVYCLAKSSDIKGLNGDDYRYQRALTAWALACLRIRFPEADPGMFQWEKLSALIESDPDRFLASLENWNPESSDRSDFVKSLKAAPKDQFHNVVGWKLIDRNRIVPVPPGHWIIFQNDCAFRVCISQSNTTPGINRESIRCGDQFIAAFHSSQFQIGDATIKLERYTDTEKHVEGTIRFLPAQPGFKTTFTLENQASISEIEKPIALFTNGRGGMSRMGIDLGQIKSKYDCLLGANLHSDLPVDRHVFAKRVRVWANADGFISPLDHNNLARFEVGPPGDWLFLANAGGGRKIAIHLKADMLDGENSTVLKFTRVSKAAFDAEHYQAADFRHCGIKSSDLAELDTDTLKLSIVVRVDIEDRNFHWETQKNGGAEHHFTQHSRALEEEAGFVFEPEPGRKLHVIANSGTYHHQGEWSLALPHPVEASRGQNGNGDAYSPGWFDVPLSSAQATTLIVSAEDDEKDWKTIENFEKARKKANQKAIKQSGGTEDDSFGNQLAIATQAYVVKRGKWKTVIAGYPWFLDWGRDSLICARGLVSVGLVKEVKQLLQIFGTYEEGGTLPNTIHGEDVSNRDTSDAPLWYGAVCKDMIDLLGEKFVETPVAKTSTSRGKTRPISDVLRSIALGYLKGTKNGIHVDRESGLVWSPSHFTWMDTNFPAGTPRAGYPVEIQVLWIQLLRLLNRLRIEPGEESWESLAEKAESSLMKYFWLEEKGYLADLLIAPSREPASAAKVDDALRSNYLIAVSLDLLTGERAQRCVQAAIQHLIIPGALRSLAPLPVAEALAVYGNEGQLLNDPKNPYWGHYEGDEDTRRKPAYHNGTAWTWPFPVFCEALVRAYDFSEPATAAAKAYLGSMQPLLETGCLGQIPEVIDGNAPHLQRGCDAQAWGVTEALRVWKLLNKVTD